MALAHTKKDVFFESMAMNLSFIGIERFPKDQLREAVQKGERDIQFQGVRQASEYGSPQQMNYTVLLKKYDEPNFYHPYAIDASIAGQPTRTRRFDLSEVPLRIENIQNLLNGRQVEKHRFNALARTVDAYWYKLDFSMRGRKNEYPLLEMSASEFFNRQHGKKWNKDGAVIDTIQKFPLRENLLVDQRLRLAREIAQGDAAPVTVLKNGSVLSAYMQFGERPDKLDLLISKAGKLLKVSPDLRELSVIPEQGEQHRHSKGRSR
ncbi:hypothetical protein [Parachryseolinea silvisoli]|uniref:hypothetical protein n=1 Tax=Parachryseolinea silvisoli TaxID=2873601 RepID=UPI002265A9CF|nr:hypothetical protein [Parachryseolinea silvisoli]MCD9015236.1 hypothetical protein [Parachryseolinea silvisoli]